MTARQLKPTGVSEFGAPPIGVDPIYSAWPWPSNAAMIERAVSRLWFPDPTVIMDLTWGAGRFWSPKMRARHRIWRNTYGRPGEGDSAENYLCLPEAWTGRWPVTVFDPPYTAKGARDGVFELMNTAYGLVDAPTGDRELMEQNRIGLREAARVTARGGLLLMKYGDFVSGGHRQFGSIKMNEYATGTVGLDLCDTFTLLRKPSQPPRTRKATPAELLAGAADDDGRVVSRQKHSMANGTTLWLYRQQ